MSPSNTGPTADDSTARGQTGHPQAPWAMYTFVPYQPNRPASATPGTPQRQSGRVKSGRSGLTFIQYQPPVPSTEDTAPTEITTPQMVNTPKENPCASTQSANDLNVAVSSVDGHLSPPGTGENPEDTIHDTSAVESTGEVQGEAPPGTSGSLEPSAATAVESTTRSTQEPPSVPTTEVNIPVADDSAPSPPSQTMDTPPVRQPTPDSSFQTANSDARVVEDHTVPPTGPSLNTTHTSSHVVTPDISSASQSSRPPETSNGDESDSDNDILDEYSTHQLRNPNRPVIPCGSRPGQRTRNFTTKVAKEIREVKNKAFDADIEALLGELAKDMKALAAKHSRSEDLVKQLIIQRTNYKNTRKANIFNALVHHIATDVNSDRPPGDRLPMRELQKLAVEAIDKLTRSEKKELLQELNDHRDTLTNGVRCNNIAANQDYQTTVTRMGAELTALTNRTGCVAIAFFAPGHINDTTFPCWVHSSNADQFVADELKMSAGEFSRRLGLWATSQNNKPKAVNKLVVLQKECAKIILEGLHNITGRRDLKMSYEKYLSDIQLSHKVRLQGWPWETNLQTPYSISVINDVRLLHDALKAGKCFWVKMTSQEYDDLSREQQGRAPKTKKKGMGKRKRGENDENADPSERPSTSKKARKRKTTAAQEPVRSRSVISNNEDSD